MSDFFAILLAVMLVIAIMLLPMWIGIFARLFVRKMTRHELAGLISLPFLYWMIFGTHSGNDLTKHIRLMSDRGESSIFMIMACILPLAIGILIWFVILRGVAGWGIRIVDAIRRRKKQNWITI